MPITESDLASLSGGNVVTTSGDKIGSIGQIYLDDQTGEPGFVAADTVEDGHPKSYGYATYVNLRLNVEVLSE
jgi:PRC-barrel domain